MWKNGFVVGVKINDRFINEDNAGKCILPFDAEYTIRLKNRNSRQAIAKVYIDGEDVSPKSKFILDVNSTLDLERFVKDLDKGDRFKFVPLSDNRVADKNNFENGCIEVHFQLVAPVVKPIVIDHITEHHHHHHDWFPYKPWKNQYPWIDDGPFYVDNTCDNLTCKADSDITFATNSNANDAVSINYCSARGMSAGAPATEKGATIKGSESRQKFSYSYIGELEAQETIITLQLVGTKDKEVVNYYTKTHCTKCGKKYNEKDDYCGKCGVKK